MEAPHNLSACLALQKTYQDQEHCLVEQCAHCDALAKRQYIFGHDECITYVCEPLLKDVEPIALSDFLLYHALIVSILLQENSLLCSITVFVGGVPCLLNNSPAWKCSL